MLIGSGKLTGRIPLFLCNPSQFWLTRYFNIPRFCNSTSAICVGVGIACSVLVVLSVRSLPCALSVQAPSGPWKSGIPVARLASYQVIDVVSGNQQKWKHLLLWRRWSVCSSLSDPRESELFGPRPQVIQIALLQQLWEPSLPWWSSKAGYYGRQSCW